jgi:nucleotidyltransferase/DNA polymerase involved in DNA repair
VIATCNYEARAYGVRSAMSSGHALKLCPDLTIVKPRMEAYREASKEIHTIFRDYTDLIEPLSLDEAYLDVSDSAHLAAAPRASPRISAGVCPISCTSPCLRAWRRTSSWPKSPATGKSPTACS